MWLQWLLWRLQLLLRVSCLLGLRRLLRIGFLQYLLLLLLQETCLLQHLLLNIACWLLPRGCRLHLLSQVDCPVWLLHWLLQLLCLQICCLLWLLPPAGGFQLDPSWLSVKRLLSGCSGLGAQMLGASNDGCPERQLRWHGTCLHRCWGWLAHMQLGCCIAGMLREWQQKCMLATWCRRCAIGRLWLQQHLMRSMPLLPLLGQVLILLQWQRLVLVWILLLRVLWLLRLLLAQGQCQRGVCAAVLPLCRCSLCWSTAGGNRCICLLQTLPMV